MTPNGWLHMIFIGLCFGFYACNSLSPDKTSDDENVRLLKEINVYPALTCDDSLEAVSLYFESPELSIIPPISFDSVHVRNNCFWTRALFVNNTSGYQKRYLYFPKGWKELICYIQRPNDIFESKKIGIDHGEEILSIQIPPMDSTLLYVQYPPTDHAYVPTLVIQELLEEEYYLFQSRIRIKYLLLGAILFYFLFFTAQVIVQKDRLNFYYVIFLLGSGGYLLTMVETLPFFEYCHKIISDIRSIQHLFLISTVLTVFGLVQYLHHFLNIVRVNTKIMRLGNLLLGMLILITIVPFIFTHFFEMQYYEDYLQFFRTGALLIFIYVFALTVWAVRKKIKFSLVLLLSFLPFVLSGIWYSASFIFAGGIIYLSIESLILIFGFLLTLLLFGVLLGIRNYSVRKENILLEKNAEYLRELNDFKSRFFTNFTHEFRTPLTVIKGMAQQIKNHDKIKILIQKNSDRLLGLVNQLLQLSKLESNKLSINWVQDDVVPYLKYLTESCHSLANDKSINLAFFTKEEHLVMDFDESKLEQILINLISNAIKYSPEFGSVKVIISKKLIEHKEFLEIIVQDTGQGIPPEQVAHIFERFYQVDPASDHPATSYQSHGFGIGLALVKELVELLSGSINLSSKLDHGSTFRVRLPIKKEASGILRPIPKVDAHITPVPLSASPITNPENRSFILVIEDNRDVIEYIFSCLKPDFHLASATNGQTGINQAIKKVPDIIICDIMMPQVNGFEVCKKLKSDPRTSHIPIILLTAKATQEDRIKGLSVGADAYLIKPFDKEELIIRIKNLINQKDQLLKKLSKLNETAGELNDQESREMLFLERLNQIIEDHLENEQFNTYFLCRSIAMSRTQLHRKLKALTGQSTGQYIRKTRLQKARILLQKTDIPIGDIAAQVGYKDFSHFSRSFLQEYGLRPSDVRG